MRDVVRSIIADYLKDLVVRDLPCLLSRLKGHSDGELKLHSTLAICESAENIEVIYKIGELKDNQVIGDIVMTDGGNIEEFISFSLIFNLITHEIDGKIANYLLNSFIAKEVIKQLICSDKEHLSYYLEKLIADNPTFSCEAFNFYTKIDDDSEVQGVYLNLNYENDLIEMRIAKKLNSSEAVSLITESKESEDFVLPYWMQKLIFNYMFDFND